MFKFFSYSLKWFLTTQRKDGSHKDYSSLRPLPFSFLWTRLSLSWLRIVIFYFISEIVSERWEFHIGFSTTIIQRNLFQMVMNASSKDKWLIVGIGSTTNWLRVSSYIISMIYKLVDRCLSRFESSNHQISIPRTWHVISYMIWVIQHVLNLWSNISFIYKLGSHSVFSNAAN